MAKKSKVKSKAKQKSSKAKSRKRKQKVHKPALRAKPKKAKLKARRAKPKAPLVVGTIDEIIQIAAKSPIAKYKWKDRGRAPRGYTKGMALTFARVYCKWKAGDPGAVAMAQAASAANKDVLGHYEDQFADVGMDNSTDGSATLRHLFALLIGLGMRESSGRYCEGRDKSANNKEADTAESGLFQTSFNARAASSLLPTLFEAYSADPSGFVDVFKEGVTVKPGDLDNWGDGLGREFQQLQKECPAFAAEFAAVGLRFIRSHWDPINTRKAELKTECDDMLLAVQNAVDASPQLCTALG